MESYNDLLDRIEQLEKNDVEIQKFLDEFSNLSKVMIPTLKELTEKINDFDERILGNNENIAGIIDNLSSINESFDSIRSILNELTKQITGDIDDMDDMDDDDDDDYEF